VRVGIAGICASGKSALVGRLNTAGYDAHEIAQEHSYVPDMWRRIHPPDVLILLTAEYDTVLSRRPNSLMTPSLFALMLRRLEHVRQHADLVIGTDRLSEEDVFGQALDYLTRL